MEPSGRNWWQRVAREKAKKSLKQAETVAIRSGRLPPNLDGKEGVDGSSPSEGSRFQANLGSRVKGETANRQCSVASA